MTCATFIAAMFTVILHWEIYFLQMIGIVNFVSLRFSWVLQKDQIQDQLLGHSLLSILKDKIHNLQGLSLPEIHHKDLLKISFHHKAKIKIILFQQERPGLLTKLNYKHKELQDQRLFKLWISQAGNQIDVVKIKDLWIIQL